MDRRICKRENRPDVGPSPPDRAAHPHTRRRCRSSVAPAGRNGSGTDRIIGPAQRRCQRPCAGQTPPRATTASAWGQTFAPGDCKSKDGINRSPTRARITAPRRSGAERGVCARASIARHSSRLRSGTPFRHPLDSLGRRRHHPRLVRRPEGAISGCPNDCARCVLAGGASPVVRSAHSVARQGRADARPNAPDVAATSRSAFSRSSRSP